MLARATFLLALTVVWLGIFQVGVLPDVPTDAMMAASARLFGGLLPPIAAPRILGGLVASVTLVTAYLTARREHVSWMLVLSVGFVTRSWLGTAHIATALGFALAASSLYCKMRWHGRLAALGAAVMIAYGTRSFGQSLLPWIALEWHWRISRRSILVLTLVALGVEGLLLVRGGAGTEITRAPMSASLVTIAELTFPWSVVMPVLALRTMTPMMFLVAGSATLAAATGNPLAFGAWVPLVLCVLQVRREAISLPAVVASLAWATVLLRDITRLPGKSFVGFPVVDLLSVPVALGLAGLAAVWGFRMVPRVRFVQPIFAVLSLPCLAGVAHALSRQSPSKILPSLFDRLHNGDELGAYLINEATLGSLGLSAARLPTERGAIDWVSSEGRSLVFATDGLPALNAAFREKHRRNIPLLDETSRFAVATFALPHGHTNRNPLEKIVSDRVPTGLHLVGKSIGQSIDLVGWDLSDMRDGRIQEVQSRAFRIRFYLRISSKPPSGYAPFIHLDHRPFRFAADHKTTLYPPMYWREGDVIEESFDVHLGRQYASGVYPLFFGMCALPCTDDTRLNVAGESDGRVHAGEIVVP